MWSCLRGHCKEDSEKAAEMQVPLNEAEIAPSRWQHIQGSKYSTKFGGWTCII